MIAQGCLEGVDEVYGLHNDPGTPVGKIRTRIGPLLAAGDRFDLIIQGRGCHAARPHYGLDPVIAGAQLITRLAGDCGPPLESSAPGGAQCDAV